TGGCSEPAQRGRLPSPPAALCYPAPHGDTTTRTDVRISGSEGPLPAREDARRTRHATHRSDVRHRGTTARPVLRGLAGGALPRDVGARRRAPDGNRVYSRACSQGRRAVSADDLRTRAREAAG